MAVTGAVHPRHHQGRVPRETPLPLARRVAGPFASFESAERSLGAGGIGVAALVHPDDWEVWAPKEHRYRTVSPSVIGTTASTGCGPCASDC